MKTKFVVLVAGLMLAALGLALVPAAKVAADVPADVLENYMIEVHPQSDGTLVMNYVLKNYCTYSDWPSDQPYLQIGVPNGNFHINDWGPKEGAIKVVQAETVNYGGTFVQLDFDRGNLPKNGDCFDLNFGITQGKMAYPDPGNGNITFKFIPAGWSFPIEVKQLNVNWDLPADPALLKLTDPKPTGTDGGNMTWTWNNPQMDANGMFNGATVRLAYDASAFTLPVEPTPAPQPASTNSQPGPDLTVWIIVGGVILVLLVIGLVSGWFEGSGDSGLGDGGDFASPPLPDYPPEETSHKSGKRRKKGRTARHESSYTPSYSRPSRRPSYTPPSHHYDDDDDSSSSSSSSSSGGGWGGSSGHSSSCACVSAPACACACACAGGVGVGVGVEEALGVAEGFGVAPVRRPVTITTS